MNYSQHYHKKILKFTFFDYLTFRKNSGCYTMNVTKQSSMRLSGSLGPAAAARPSVCGPTVAGLEVGGGMVPVAAAGWEPRRCQWGGAWAVGAELQGRRRDGGRGAPGPRGISWGLPPVPRPRRAVAEAHSAAAGRWYEPSHSRRKESGEN